MPQNLNPDAIALVDAFRQAEALFGSRNKTKAAQARRQAKAAEKGLGR